MGVKMNCARDAKSHNVVTLADRENGHEGPLICETRECSAAISFTGSHEKRLHNNTYSVSSFFKLKKGEEHSESCPHNTLGLIKILARDSDSDIIKSISNEKFAFSLQILHKIGVQSNQHPKANSSGNPIDHTPRKKKVWENSGKASSYIKKLQQILTLRRKLEEDSDLSKHLVLNYRKQEISWRKFYFETDDYLKAYKVIQGMADPTYPICVCGRIKSINEPTEKFQYYSVVLHSPFVKVTNTIKDVPIVQLTFPAKTFNSQLKEKDSVITYGIANAKKSDNLYKKSIRFLNIRFWINHKDQVLVIPDSDDA